AALSHHCFSGSGRGPAGSRVGLSKSISYEGVVHMKKLLVVVVVALTPIVGILVSAFAQSPMSPWAYYIELTPGSDSPGVYTVKVPLRVMDKSQDDLSDLRLYDGQNREIQYALRVREEVHETRAVNGRTFNNATAGAKASEISVDLGDSPGEHNQVEIE